MSNQLFFCKFINNSVNSGYSGEIFLNPNPNQIIRLFLWPTRDQSLTDFKTARGPLVRAGGSVGPGHWTALRETLVSFTCQTLPTANLHKT